MEVEEDDDEYEDIEENKNVSKSKKPKSKGGRPRKSFATSGKSQKRAKLQDPYHVLEKASKLDDIPFPVLLGVLAKYHYNKDQCPLSESDKKWLELFELIANGINPIEEHTVPVEKGVYMNENLVHGRDKWQKMRDCTAPFANLPSNHKLRQFRDEYHPKTGT